jgi:protein phosphatase
MAMDGLPHAASAGLFRPSLLVGLASHPGRTRAQNEDAVVALVAAHAGVPAGEEFGLFIVADGMGGQIGGQRAAQLAARTAARTVASQIYLPFLRSAAPDADRPPLQEVLIGALREANDAVHTQLPESGTTLTAALLLGGEAYLAHVGDSRAYLLLGGRLQRLTRDHTFVERLHELGQLSTAELSDHPQRNVLYRAVGQGDGLEVDVTRHAVPPGARLLLCCDGLWGVVADETLAAVLSEAPTPQAACERLVAAALEAGGPDNISAVLVEIAGP